MSDVEVIVTTYNNPTALHFALLGLQGQTCQAFSVCIADDGSTESTRQVVEIWRQKFGPERFRHVWHPDKGFAKNQILNKAISSSKADYLVFLDGDCIASPDYLKRHLELLNRPVGERKSKGDLLAETLQSIVTGVDVSKVEEAASYASNAEDAAIEARNVGSKIIDMLVS